MVNIVFLVGKESDEYPKKYNDKKAPKWLKHEATNFKTFINDDKTVPSDVAMAMYLSYKHPKDFITCLFGFNVNKKQLDRFDVVFVIYDPIEVFHCGGHEKTCPQDSKKFERILKETTAFVYPYPEFHKYIIVKPSYYKDLNRAGIPVAPFFKITPHNVINNITKFRNNVKKRGWNGIIVKPSYAGYSIGIKVFKKFDRTLNKTIINYFKKLEKYGFPNVTIQEFVESFGTNFEIRTYWINGKYTNSIGTLTEAVGHGDGLPITDINTFKSEGGSLPDHIKSKLKKLGSYVLKALPRYPIPHPMVRIDFGCCIHNNSCDDTYFVNEVETMAANLLPKDTNYKIVEKLADAVYTFSKKVKNKSNKDIKPIKSNFKVPSNICIN